MKQYYVMNVEFKDGTKWKGVVDYALDLWKTRERLLKRFRTFYSREEVKRKGGAIATIRLAHIGESVYSRADKVKTEKEPRNVRFESDKNLHTESKTKRCRQS